MAMFKGFKPQGLQKIASKMGYAGRMEEFDSYLQQNPDKQREMIVFQSKAQEMARGGSVVRMAVGGMPTYVNPIDPPTDPNNPFGPVGSAVMRYAYNPTTNQYSISGGGQQSFPEGFESSGDYGELYKKYPQIKGSFEAGVPDSIPGGEYDKRNSFDNPMFGKPYDYENDTTPDPRPTPVGNVPIINQTYREPSGGNTSQGNVANLSQSNVPQTLTDPRGLPQATVPTTTGFVNPDGTPANIGNIGAQQMIAPSLPVGGVTVPVGTQATQDQMIGSGVGQVSGTVAVPTSMATTTGTTQPEAMTAQSMTADTAIDAVDTALNATQAAQLNPNDPRSQVTAAQQTVSSVGNLNEAQGNATLMSNPVQRQIQSGEIISGAANAETASTYAEQIQAATATPTDQATVAGQLASLTANFDASNPPSWAAGTLRAIQAQMAARGLGASSMAGQALIQGALESALPIAQADAQVEAQFEIQNLSNRQQRAMLAAQQRAVFIGQEFDQSFQAKVANASRIGDIANMNFTAEQQIGLENSRAVNTMNLSNLSNTQAMTMAEASALSQLDMSSLNNRQQAAVQNANSFLQTDMANATNLQQTNLFKAQQRTQALFTDQAATNATRQFNATSQAQTDQFFANLSNQAAQFNATQSNAQAQFNAGQANTVERFNAELNNQRDQFNAQNQTVIAQSNATWRREIATADTVAVNRANELNANAILGISKTAYDNLWTHYGDTMEWAWTSAENELDRIAKITTSEITAEASMRGYEMQADAKAASGLGSMIGTVLSAGSNTLIGGWLGACWVAREIYGKTDPRWVVFRMWLDKDAPTWFKKLYLKHGESFAEYIKDRPRTKKVVKYFMDIVIDRPTQYLKGKKDAELQTSK